MSERVAIHCGQSEAVLPMLPADSFDAMLTDPPAGVKFMGREWDSNKGGRDAWIAWLSGVMREALRTLKPGAHGLVWALPRTSHWTGMALETAGFEVRDRISHMFATGFPKSGNLKPATEDWWLVRKPFSEKSRAANVARWGTGALQIEAGRIAHGEECRPMKAQAEGGKFYGQGGRFEPTLELKPSGRYPAHVVFSHAPECVRVGERWVQGNPMSVRSGTRQSGYGFKAGAAQGHTDADGLEVVESWECIAGCPVRELGLQSGESASSDRDRRNTAEAHNRTSSMGKSNADWITTGHEDAGTASRFFANFSPDPLDDLTPFAYYPKPSGSERGIGCGDLPPGNAPGSKRSTPAEGRQAALGSPRTNHHPTVKSVALMRYLAKLICPPGGHVLDCFAGSFSTGVACVLEDFAFTGIEQEADFCAIGRARMAYAVEWRGTKGVGAPLKVKAGKVEPTQTKLQFDDPPAPLKPASDWQQLSLLDLPEVAA